MNEGVKPEIVENHLPLACGHDLANHVLDLAEDALGLLDARGRRRAYVQAELAGVDGREEIFAEPRRQAQRAGGEAEHQYERE